MTMYSRKGIVANPEIDEDGCWNWTGYIDRNGYGKAYDPGRKLGNRVDWAHRVSYYLHKGDIPTGYEIDHVCENTRCVNPEHLDAVTKIEHARRTFHRLGKDRFHTACAILRRDGMTYQEIADAMNIAGREGARQAVQSAIRKGLIDPSDVPVSRHLNPSDREDIRGLYAFGMPQTEIAAWYGIDPSHASRICSGRSSGRSVHQRAAS